MVFVIDEKVEPEKKKVVFNMLKNWHIASIKPVFYSVDTTNYQQVFAVFAEIIAKYKDCVLDITGGQNLSLFTAGKFFEMHNLPCFLIDMHTLTFHNINKCENLAKKFILPRFRVKDILSCQGAKIEGYGKYRPEKTDTEMLEDILKAWKIIWKSPQAWANNVSWVQQALKFSTSGNKNAEQLTYETYIDLKVGNSFAVKANLDVLKALNNVGIITYLKTNKNHITLTFKNVALKNCLTSHGIWLELYGFISSYQLNWFNDVKTSVMIGWQDRVLGPNDTRNEIDIMVVKGITPLFISCKMGVPNALALSEIKTLSLRFGGVLAKAVIFTASEVRKSNPTIVNRAKELNIYIIDKNDIDANKVQDRLKEIAESYN